MSSLYHLHDDSKTVHLEFSVMEIIYIHLCFIIINWSEFKGYIQLSGAGERVEEGELLLQPTFLYLHLKWKIQMLQKYTSGTLFPYFWQRLIFTAFQLSGLKSTFSPCLKLWESEIKSHEYICWSCSLCCCTYFFSSPQKLCRILVWVTGFRLFSSFTTVPMLHLQSV